MFQLNGKDCQPGKERNLSHIIDSKMHSFLLFDVSGIESMTLYDGCQPDGSHDVVIIASLRLNVTMTIHIVRTSVELCALLVVPTLNLIANK